MTGNDDLQRELAFFTELESQLEMTQFTWTIGATGSIIGNISLTVPGVGQLGVISGTADIEIQVDSEHFREHHPEPAKYKCLVRVGCLPLVMDATREFESEQSAKIGAVLMWRELALAIATLISTMADLENT